MRTVLPLPPWQLHNLKSRDGASSSCSAPRRFLVCCAALEWTVTREPWPGWQHPRHVRVRRTSTCPSGGRPEKVVGPQPGGKAIGAPFVAPESNQDIGLRLVHGPIPFRSGKLSWQPSRNGRAQSSSVTRTNRLCLNGAHHESQTGTVVREPFK